MRNYGITHLLTSMLVRLTLAVLLLGYFPSKGQLIEQLLASDTSKVVQQVLKDTGTYRLQVIYTEITDNKSFWGKQQTELTTHTFRNKPKEYFFPASLVKLPVSAFALEKIASLYPQGINESTPFAPLNDFQCIGKSTNNAPQSTKDLIKKVFVYSDNAAFNYLYELCGQSYVQTRLKEMGYPNARIVEKIARCNSSENQNTGPVAFYANQELLYVDVRKESPQPEMLPIPAKIGHASIFNGKLVQGPKDFSASNFIPLQDAHSILLSLVLPKEVDEDKRFKITESQRMLLMKSMSTLPKNYCPDSCNGQTFKDNYVKYLMGTRDTLPSKWKIYNKVGLAHGFMSDCSYFEDSLAQVRFFLSAVIYVNADGVLNDGKYEYATIGTPFMKRLGELIYEYERKKKVK